MKVRIAIERFGNAHTLEKKSDIKFIGHAYSAVHLDGFLSRQLCNPTNLRLGD